MRFAGKTVWITGASSGIGAALARAFAADGASVILSGRNAAALAEVAADCPGSRTLAFDTTDFAALPGIATAAGAVDILVNNAGISQRSLALDTGFDVYRTVMEVDFFAPLRLTQLVLPDMVARGSGAVVNIASVAGKIGSPLRTGYCAAKHAMVGWSDALRAEIAQYGVAVHVVAPGFVRTNVAVNAIQGDGSTRGHSDAAIEAGISPESAAATILDGIAAGTREILVGDGPEMGLVRLARQRRRPAVRHDGGDGPGGGALAPLPLAGEATRAPARRVRVYPNFPRGDGGHLPRPTPSPRAAPAGASLASPASGEREAYPSCPIRCSADDTLNAPGSSTLSWVTMPSLTSIEKRWPRVPMPNLLPSIVRPSAVTKSALPSASIVTLPAAPLLCPHAAMTKASLTETQTISSTPAAFIASAFEI